MITSTLQDRIKLALEMSGRSKTDLWKGCGVSSGTVTAWFKGPNQTISGINLMNACKILGVNPEWLATGMGEMQTDIHHLYSERLVKCESIESSYQESSVAIHNIHIHEPIKSINFDLDWLKSRLPNHSLENLNKYKEAIENYEKAIKVNPNQDNYYNNLGISLHNLKKYKEAIKNYEKAIKINPNDANYYYNLRLAKEKLKSILEK